MEKQVLITAMKNSISEVLETMFFLPIDFPDVALLKNLWNSEQDDIITARLNFSGFFSGHCVFYITRKMAVSITADFTGEDEESISDDQVKETVKEITNMIAGSTFSNYDEKSAFNLEIPELVKFNDYKDYPDSEKEILIVIETLENHMAFQMVVN